MAKKISQETFDDVVKENIEEFDMDAAEALQDAIKQFLKQGVTLTNIDTSGGVGRQEILDAISELDKVARSGGSTEGILNAIKSVSTMSSKDYPLFERNLMLINEKGGLNSLHLLFDVKQPTSVLLATMSLLNDLSKLNGKSLRVLVHQLMMLFVQLKSETSLSLVVVRDCVM